jgi:hypothetical protein
MDGFDGLTAVQKPVQADHVVIERWYLYTAKSSWTADLPSGGSHHVTVEDLYTVRARPGGAVKLPWRFP